MQKQADGAKNGGRMPDANLKCSARLANSLPVPKNAGEGAALLAAGIQLLQDARGIRVWHLWPDELHWLPYVEEAG